MTEPDLQLQAFLQLLKEMLADSILPVAHSRQGSIDSNISAANYGDKILQEHIPSLGFTTAGAHCLTLLHQLVSLSAWSDCLS